MHPALEVALEIEDCVERPELPHADEVLSHRPDRAQLAETARAAPGAPRKLVDGIDPGMLLDKARVPVFYQPLQTRLRELVPQCLERRECEQDVAERTQAEEQDSGVRAQCRRLGWGARAPPREYTVAMVPPSVGNRSSSREAQDL